MDSMKRMEKRMTKIEDTLDKIANNHLTHIERYTKITLFGILVSVAVSMIAVYVSVVGV